MEELNIIIDSISIIDANMKEIINHKVKIPYLDDYNNLSAYWYPHPPCLIPLFLGYGASYKGVIQHFFCNRKNTFGAYFPEQGFITEIARNSKQWITLIVLKMLMIKEGLDDEIINFCKAVNYTDYEELDEFTLEYGDDPNEFKHLIYLKDNIPSIYLKEISQYTGDFPSTLSAINTRQIKNAGALEIAVPEQLVQTIDLPLWLKSDVDKQQLFNDYISKDMLKEAWFTLNSKGWKLNDLSSALEELASKTDDRLFHLVTKNWVNGLQRSNSKGGAY